MDSLEIPKEHWQEKNGAYGTDSAMIPYWERSLRANIAKQPDVRLRFTEWLSAKEAGAGTYGVRLLFIEQPYLGWAESVENAIETAERTLREAIAFEITNPNRD